MLNAQWKKLDQWSGPRCQSRKSGVFKATWLQTLDLLEYELGKLRAKDVVIQIEDPEGIKGIRNDGTIRLVSQSYYRNMSGVILMFESPTKGNISMPCDGYEDWKDNVRALALSLQALRAVDRYGVTRGNEQYKGWTQIGNGNGKMDRASALKFVEKLAGAPFGRAATTEMITQVCRALKVRYHPDREGGSHETFVAIGQAEEVLVGVS